MRRKIMLPVILAVVVLAICTAVVLLVETREDPHPVPPQSKEPTASPDAGPVPKPDAQDPRRGPSEEASTKPAPVEVAEPPAVEPVYEGRPMSSWIDELRTGDRRARWKALVALHKVPYDVDTALPLIMEIGRGDDPLLRAAAANALGAYGRKAEAAVPLLEDLVKDPAGLMVRRAAVVALGRAGAGVESAVVLLVPLLSDHDQHCQTQAADALAQMGERGLGELVAHVEESFGIRSALFRPRLVEAMARGGPAAVPKLAEWLERRKEYAHPPDVINIARALGQIGPDAREAVPALSRVAAQGDPASYSAAVYALLRIGPAHVDADEAVPNLIQDLGRLKYGNFDAASEALALVGAGAVPGLIEAMEQGSGPMRRQACVSLGRMGAEARDAVPALLEEVKTNRSGVRLYAMRALGRIGERSEEVVPLLIGSLEDPKLRCWALLSLADLGANAQAAVPFIRPFLKDKDVTVRDRAETALRKIRAALRSVPPPEEQIEDVF